MLAFVFSVEVPGSFTFAAHNSQILINAGESG
jgi:hypothetical protein